MTYGIFTDSGNAVAWYDSRDEAVAELVSLVSEEPEAADSIAVIPFDDAGRACGEAITASSVSPQPA